MVSHDSNEEHQSWTVHAVFTFLLSFNRPGFHEVRQHVNMLRLDAEEAIFIRKEIKINMELLSDALQAYSLMDHDHSSLVI